MRVATAAMTAVMLFQGTPGGILSAYAATEGITVDLAAQGDDLKQELAAYSDEFPAGAFAFREPSVALTEGDGDAEVQVVRMGGTAPAATVDVKVISLTASYDDDYTVYVKDGLTTVPLEVSTDDATAEGTSGDGGAAETGTAANPADEAATSEEAAASTDAAEDFETTSPLRTAYTQQTGTTTVDTDWRGAYEEYLAPEAAVESANEIINAVPGAANTLSFAEGEYVKTLYIHVNDDDKSESDEAFKLLLGNATEGVLGEQMQFDVSITDNDPDEPIEFALQEAEVVTESGATTAEVTIERTSGMDYYAGAVVRTASGTATSSDAYTAIDGATVPFAPGVTEQTVTVELTGTGATGTYFDVMIDDDAANVAEGRDKTRVWIGERGEAVEDAAPTTGEEGNAPADAPAAADAAEQTDQPMVGVDEGDGTAGAVHAETPEALDATIAADAEEVDAAAAPSDAADEVIEETDAAASDAATAEVTVENAPLAETAGPLTGSTGVSATASPSLGAVARAAAAPVATRAVTAGGVVYDEDVRNLNWSTKTSNGNNSSAWVYGTISGADQATRAYVQGQVSGYTDWWIFGDPAFKNYTIYVGGQQVAHADADAKTYNYAHTFNLNWAQSQSREFKFLANADGTNDHAKITCSTLKLYYPRYTLTMAASDAKQTLKGRSYTSTKNSTEFNVSTLTGNPSWSSITVAHNRGTSIAPGNLTNGVKVQRYELYVGGTKVKETTSSYLSYSDLNSIRASYDSLLRSNGYRITVKPVYTTQAATVTFTSEDASAIAFSGDKAGGTGFKVGDTLSCTMIDRITFTATCPTNQEIAVSSVARSQNANGSGAIAAYTPTSDAERQSLTKTVDIDYATETYRVYYRDLTLTYEYTPDEASASNATAGSVVVYNVDDLENPLGATTVGQPLTLRDRVSMLRNNYVASVIPGEGFETVDGPNGLSYTTRTIWTHRDAATGMYKTTTGNSFVFNPYYADEVVNYHFKSVQNDEVPVGVTGTVYIDEQPLFSSGEQVLSKPAVGVQMNVGGENTVTANDGTYQIPAKFNKGEYVSAFLNYDSLTMMDEVALSRNTVKDFHIDVDEAEPLTVVDSTMSKLTDTGERGMNNKTIYEDKAVSVVLLEDAQYTFKVTANGSAGVTPARAEFRFYAKDGQLKSTATRSVTFEGNTATLQLNPMTANLAVGDSMTVKLYDTTGAGYFEHQTSVILGEKMAGMYTFNYEGAWADEDDNLFIQALGGISIGYDFVLDALASTGGTYAEEDGTQHQLMYIGFGDGFSNAGPNADEEVYQTMQETIANIKDVNTGNYKLSLSDNIAIFGNKSWSLNVNVGVIYDAMLQDEGAHKGEFMFSDYLIIANVGANYYREWEVPISSIKLTFTLTFNFGNQDEGTSGLGVKWHFYNPDEEPLYVASNDSIDLMASDDVESEGYFGLNVGIDGSVGVLPAKFLEIIGALKVELNNNVAYDGALTEDQWADYGSIILAPTIKIKVLKIPIPLWTDTWRYDWTTRNAGQGATEAQARMMSAISENLSTEQILYTDTSTAEALDYSYTENRSGWNAGAAAALFRSLVPRSAESVEEQVLQSGFLSDADIAVQDLGDGRYLAAFLDVVDGRSDDNNMAAYYTIYDGSSWSAPQLLETDDGTEDQRPVICAAGDAGYLITWSDASRAFEADEPLSDRLNTFNLTGRFFDAATGELGEVMEITKGTEQDTVADAAPQVTFFTDTAGNDHLKIYYTKSEYEITDAAEGEVVGDLMNPYQVIAVRDYDLTNEAWVDTYPEKIKAQIIEQLKEQLGDAYTDDAYDKYVTNWYGQQFLNLAPAVSVSETLDEDGFWAAGTTATITELDSNASQQSMVKDGAAIGYNGLSLYAYSLDKGGMAQATGDQMLYLQIYNSTGDEYHHPIQLSTRDADISDIQFVRTAAPKNGQGEVTWLYWKEQGTVETGTGETVDATQIKRLNISSLVSDESNLIKDMTSTGQAYYYINKDADSNYSPATVLVTSTPETEDASDYVTIGNFKVRVSADGRYSYLVWTQPVSVETEDGGTKQEQQLFAMREDLTTGERSMPVQLTDEADQYVMQFDVAVNNEGNLDVLAARERITEQPVLDTDGSDTGVTAWQPDATTSELVFWKITPSDTFTLGAVEQGASQVAEDGTIEATLTGSAYNDSFATREDVTVEAVDASGDVVWSTTDPLATYESTTTSTADGGVTFEDTEVTTELEPVDMVGGEKLDLAIAVPVDETGAYDVTLRARSGDEVIAEQRVTGSVPEALTTSGLATQILERDVVKLSTTVTNKGLLPSEERTASYGYLDADGAEHALGEVTIPALEPGSSTEVSVEAETAFAEFASTRGADGSLTGARTFYLDLDPAADDAPAPQDAAADASVATPVPDNTATMIYGTVELTATAEQIALMESLGSLSAVYAQYDDEGALVEQDGLKAGDAGYLALTVDGAIAQNEENLTNGLKVVWDAVDTDVATVTEDGAVKAKAAGTLTLTGKVMPADTASSVSTTGAAEAIDNYAMLPEETIKPLTVNLTITGPSDGGNGDGTINGPGTGPGFEGGIPNMGDVALFAGVMAAVAGVVFIAVGAGLKRRRKKGDA